MRVAATSIPSGWPLAFAQVNASEGGFAEVLYIEGIVIGILVQCDELSLRTMMLMAFFLPHCGNAVIVSDSEHCQSRFMDARGI